MLIENLFSENRDPPRNASGSGDCLREQLRGKRLLIVDEALKGFMGHWYEYDRAVVAMNRDAGVHVTLAAHAQVEPEIQTSLGAMPVFRYTNWDNIYAYPQAWRRYIGILRHNWRVYRRLDRFFLNADRYDCVFVPTTVLYHVIAWRFLLLRHGGRRFRRLVLFFRNDVGAYSSEKGTTVFKKVSVLYGFVLRLFGSAGRRGSISLATDSERLAADYRQLCGIDFQVFPNARVGSPAAPAEKAEARSRPLTFSCLGPARMEKGIDVLQAAIRRFLSAEPDAAAHFVIQWNMDIVDESGGIYAPDPQLQLDPRVRFLREPLDSDSYARVLAETDCMLLPYRLASYYARISGVAVEAVTAGIPLVYTNNSWIETIVHDSGAGIGVGDGDIEGLATAIARMAKEQARYRAEALLRCNLASESHANIFMQKLWGLPAR